MPKRDLEIRHKPVLPDAEKLMKTLILATDDSTAGRLKASKAAESD